MRGVACKTAGGLVTGEAVVGADQALSCVRIAVVPELARSVAEIVRPEVVAGSATGAE